MMDYRSKKTDSSSYDVDKMILPNRIDELEMLLARKNSKKKQLKSLTPEVKLKVGTDGIPVLVDVVTDTNIDLQDANLVNMTDKKNKLIDNVMNQVDKSVSQALGKQVALLKDDIIKEVRTKLLQELKKVPKKTD